MILTILFFIQNSVSASIFFNNKALSGVSILDSKQILLSKSDKNGRFVIAKIEEISFPILLQKSGFQNVYLYSDQLTNGMRIFMSQETHIYSDSVLVQGENSLFDQLKESIPIRSYPLRSNIKSGASLKSQFATRAGILFQESSGQASAPIIAGFRSNKLLYVLNGIRFNNALFKSGNTPYLSLINPIYYQNISIIHGATSLLYGSDAIGAALDYKITEEDSSFNLYSGYSSADGFLYAGVSAAIQKQIFQHRFSIYTAKSGNREEGKNGNSQLAYPNGEMQTSFYQQNIDYDFNAFFSDSEFDFGFHFAKQYLADDFFRLFYKKSKHYQYNPLEFIQLYANYTKQYPHGNYWKNTLHFNHFKEFKDEFKNTERFFHDALRSVGFRSLFHLNLHDKKVMNFALDILKEETDTKAENDGIPIQSKYPNDASQTQLGVFLSFSKEFTNDKFTAALRFSRTQTKIATQNFLDSLLGKSLTSYDKALNVFNYSLSYERNINSHRITALLFTAFRSPNFDDLAKNGEIKDNVIAIPNLDIQAEESVSFQLHHSWYHDFFHIENQLSYTNLRSLIEARRTDFNDSNFLISSGDTLYYEHNENSSDAFLSSFNTRLHFDLFSFKNTLSFALQYAEERGSKKALSKIPPARLSFTSSYELSNTVSLSANYLYSARQNRLSDADKNDKRILNSGSPAYYRLDLGLFLKWKGYSVNIQVQNLSDQRYRNHASALNGKARSLQLDMHYQF